jgi:hypothetical protein
VIECNYIQITDSRCLVVRVLVVVLSGLSYGVLLLLPQKADSTVLASIELLNQLVRSNFLPDCLNWIIKPESKTVSIFNRLTLPQQRNRFSRRPYQSPPGQPDYPSTDSSNRIKNNKKQPDYPSTDSPHPQTTVSTTTVFTHTGLQSIASYIQYTLNQSIFVFFFIFFRRSNNTTINYQHELQVH